MKILLKLLIISFALTGGIAFAQNSHTQCNTDIIRLLDNGSSIANRLKGFQLAEEVDSENVNTKLVDLLDSHIKGGKEHDLLLLPSWHEALIILARRFPEAGIAKEPISYQRGDAIKFKNWWHGNRTRIKYHNNTHSLDSETAW